MTEDEEKASDFIGDNTYTEFQPGHDYDPFVPQVSALWRKAILIHRITKLENIWCMRLTKQLPPLLSPKRFPWQDGWSSSIRGVSSPPSESLICLLDLRKAGFFSCAPSPRFFDNTVVSHLCRHDDISEKTWMSSQLWRLNPYDDISERKNHRPSGGKSDVFTDFPLVSLAFPQHFAQLWRHKPCDDLTDENFPFFKSDYDDITHMTT